MIKQILAIASGKGGVGKSTVAFNLACALKTSGHSVGLLDADLYGPSLPLLMGIPNETNIQYEEKKIKPIIANDIPTMSIGYLVDASAPAIWRGPMASKAIQQLFYDTIWGDLDYLIVDLPPGTGDIHLTLIQKLVLHSAVIVTTPQNIALADVRKCIAMFQKLNIPIAGIIENMSHHTCGHCGHHTSLFGEGGGMALSTEYKIPLLGQLPFDSQIQSEITPLLLVDPTHRMSRLYSHIIEKMHLRNSQLKRKIFPKVVVES